MTTLELRKAYWRVIADLEEKRDFVDKTIQALHAAVEHMEAEAIRTHPPQGEPT